MIIFFFFYKLCHENKTRQNKIVTIIFVKRIRFLENTLKQTVNNTLILFKLTYVLLVVIVCVIGKKINIFFLCFIRR